MPKQLSLSMMIDLPADVFDAGDALAKVRGPWAALLAALKEAGIKHVAACEEIETRAKVERKPRERRVAVQAVQARQAAEELGL